MMTNYSRQDKLPRDWELLRYVSGKREETLRAWRDHGPCTTEALAELNFWKS